MLEKACENLEYSELLDNAAKQRNSMGRLMYVAAFAISGYASSQWRTDRKVSSEALSITWDHKLTSIALQPNFDRNL